MYCCSHFTTLGDIFGGTFLYVIKKHLIAILFAKVNRVFKNVTRGMAGPTVREVSGDKELIDGLSGREHHCRQLYGWFLGR